VASRAAPAELQRSLGRMSSRRLETLGEFAPESLVLCFHLGEELNEFWRLADAIQISIAGVSGIEVKARDGSFSQPLDGFSALAFQRIDAGNVIGGMMVKRVVQRMNGENVRNLRFSGGEISL